MTSPILWPPDAKSQIIGKDLMLGKIEGRRRRRRQRMKRLDGITKSMGMNLSKLEGSLACCSPWGCKELDMTEQLNNNNVIWILTAHACVLSHFSCVHPFVTPWTVARQAPLSMGFSRQEYWSGLPFPSPEDLSDPGIKPASVSCIAGRFFTI